jgi:ankyrin repeat protein
LQSARPLQDGAVRRLLRPLATTEPEVSPLLQARYHGDEAEAARLLDEKPELDVFEAATFGRLERLGELLAQESQLARAYTVDGFTALHLAAFFGQPEAARLLLEAGADPGAVSKNAMQVQPLHSAAAARNLEAARLLLEAGADPNTVQQDEFRPLDAAIQNEDEPLRELLLEHGADRNLVKTP